MPSTDLTNQTKRLKPNLTPWSKPKTYKIIYVLEQTVQKKIHESYNEYLQSKKSNDKLLTVSIMKTRLFKYTEKFTTKKMKIFR